MIVAIVIGLLLMYPPLVSEDEGISEHPIWSLIYAIPAFYFGPWLILLYAFQKDSLFYKLVGAGFLLIHLLMIIINKSFPISKLTRRIFSSIGSLLMFGIRLSFVALFLYTGYMLTLWIPQTTIPLTTYCKDNVNVKPYIENISAVFQNLKDGVNESKESLGITHGITVSQDSIELDMIEHPSEPITVSVNNNNRDFYINWTNAKKIKVEEVDNKNGSITFNITARWEGECDLTFTLVDSDDNDHVYDTEIVHVKVTNSAPDRLFEYNSHLYSCYDISMSWTEAEAYCRGLGGHLASINDANEQELIMAMSASYCNKQNVWIGGYFENDSWKWTDGSSFSYQNWDAEKPDNYEDNEFFLRYANNNVDYETWSAKQGKWDDCAENGSGDDSDAPLSSFGFVCEWDSREEYTSKNSIKVSENSVEYNGHSYLLYTDMTNSWEEAENFCKSHGGHLATINDSEENSFIYNYMISCGYQSAYFGLVDRNYDGIWAWADGSDVNYTNWAEGEPNSTSEPYGMFYYKFTDGTWNDGRWGDDTTAFICEWDTIMGDTGSSSMSNIINKYSGTYSAGQGLTSLDFTIISIDNDDNITAVFAFHENPDNPGVPSGSYKMEGKVLDISSDGIITVEFIGTEWVERPSGYSMLDFIAVINPSNGTINSDSYNISLN